MRKRRVGAIARFKATRRRIQRERLAGIGVATPSHLASGAPAILRGQDGKWSIWSAPIPGPPFVPAQFMAGDFDTRDEAQAWLDDQ